MDIKEPHIHTLLIDPATRREAIDAILAHLSSLKVVPPDSIAMIRDGIDRRESLGSTAIGNGVAMPHMRTDGVTWPVLTVARLARPGDDWDSLDGEPVDLVFLILAPTEVPKAITPFFEHLMRAISKGRGDRLRGASSPVELEEALRAIVTSPWTDD